MKNFKKEKERYKTRIDTKNFNELIEPFLEGINKLYKFHGLDLRINTAFMKLEVIGKFSYAAGNFYFYPTHKIYEYDGKGEKHIGYRIRFTRKTRKNKLDHLTINLKNETLKKGKWLEEIASEGFKLDMEIEDIDELMEATLLVHTERKVFTSVIGWVRGRKSFHYVPITNYKTDDISCNKKIRQTYKHKPHIDMDYLNAFVKMRQLLDATNKTITIPLLSFTILSSLLSLIQRNTDELPKFMICLCGGSNGRSKKALANLFCNIYNRSAHIYELDSKLHSIKSLKSQISEKASKMRDAVFISEIEKRSDLGSYTKLFDQNNLSGGLLLISNDVIQHDSVIDIDISGAAIDESIFELHKSNPAIFYTWFDSFMRYIQRKLKDDKWGIGVKGNVDNFYKNCIEKIVEKNGQLDPNKLEYYAWLFVGFTLFMNFGLEICAISEGEFKTSINEAVVVFHKLSSLDLGEENENLEPSISQVEKDAVAFLNAIDKLLTDGDLIQRGDNSTKPIWGWFDKDKLYLRNQALYTEVELYLFNQNQYKLKTKSSKIYEFLYEKGIIPEKEEKGWGIQIYGEAKAICYSIPLMKRILEEKGYELAFLSNR